MISFVIKNDRFKSNIYCSSDNVSIDLHVTNNLNNDENAEIFLSSRMINDIIKIGSGFYSCREITFSAQKVLTDHCLCYSSFWFIVFHTATLWRTTYPSEKVSIIVVILEYDIF